MGIGTITVRFMADQLRAVSNNGFPLASDVDAVTNYINFKRPVTVKDTFVFGPIPQPIDVRIANLVPNDEATRATVQQSLLNMLSAWSTRPDNFCGVEVLRNHVGG